MMLIQQVNLSYILHTTALWSIKNVLLISENSRERSNTYTYLTVLSGVLEYLEFEFIFGSSWLLVNCWNEIFLPQFHGMFLAVRVI